MVSIEDLALLSVREGRVADVKRLAEEIFPIFRREAVAALMLFQEAARQEQLTVKAVRESAKYFHEARTDPTPGCSTRPRVFRPAEMLRTGGRKLIASSDRVARRPPSTTSGGTGLKALGRPPSLRDSENHGGNPPWH
ncbi:MAG TPA: hypothetical protein VE685_25560 [Thermoanaerobaculia bacterium]|nr:hypothetical protein [Thermoanaerobaculia bacterium]